MTGIDRLLEREGYRVLLAKDGVDALEQMQETRPDLMLLDIASGRIDQLTDGLERDMQETWAIHNVYPGISWTPDGKSIVYWAKGGFHRIDVATKAVTDIPFHVASSRFVEDAIQSPREAAERALEILGRQSVAVALGQLEAGRTERAAQVAGAARLDHGLEPLEQEPHRVNDLSNHELWGGRRGHANPRSPPPGSAWG